MDTTTPFSPLPRGFVGYNIMRDDNSSSDNTSQTNSRWNSRLQVKELHLPYNSLLERSMMNDGDRAIVAIAMERDSFGLQD